MSMEQTLPDGMVKREVAFVPFTNNSTAEFVVVLFDSTPQILCASPLEENLIPERAIIEALSAEACKPIPNEVEPATVFVLPSPKESPAVTLLSLPKAYARVPEAVF